MLAGCSNGPAASSTETAARLASIHRAEYLTVDGAGLFLMIRGEDRRRPILLWLHGGPGGAERPLFRYYNGDLEKHLVVAYWDQRGAGRSFDLQADPRRLTVARHLTDLDVVVDHLRYQFGRDKIILVGHSWGSMLGLLYAQRHPEKVAALIAVAPLIAPLESQRQEHAFILGEATRRQDEAVLARLCEIGPPPYETADQVLAIESLAGRYGAVFHRQPNRFWVLVAGVFRRLVTPWEIPRFLRANRVSLDAMTPELLTLDLTRSVPRIAVPVFFLLGRYDHHAGSAIAAHYFKVLEAPEKRLIWFEHSAHNPPFEEPARLDKVIERLARTLDSGASPPGCLHQRRIQTP
ncbi:alpha/beta hydrolase [Halomonas sp. GXIMD04776]|uniref:alpha/beta hydrolase n=1 Tax=Halomonas sp. GXIMD04776 TaxID=3415605 RepID=UPI003C82D7F1